MKSKRLLLLLLMALIAPWAMNAQNSIPFNEGFESMTSVDDLTAAGWTLSTTESGTFLAIETTASNVYEGSKSLNLDAWNASSSSSVQYLGLPLVAGDLNTLQISFAYKVSSGTINVGYLTDATDFSTFTSLAQYSSSSSFTVVTTDLSEAPRDAARLVLKYTGWYRCYLDSFEVKVLPSCQAATSITASDITATSATIAWEGEGNTWNLKYNGIEVNGISAMSYNLTSLTDGTNYTVSVQNVCSDGTTTDWISTTFRTPEICPDGKICIGEGTTTSTYLPANNYYNYSLSQQIYTADEIGEAGAILSIDFFKASTYEMVKNLDIYMVSTTKDEFESTTDFIPVTASDLVFSGTVTFADNAWTTIELDNPFVYDGTSNVAIMVDNNTGGYVSSTPFYVFSSDKNQALYAQNDGTNFDPLAPAFTSRTAQKNRIRLAIGEPPACPKPTGLTVNYTGGTEATISWTSDATAWNMRVNGTEINGTITNPYTLTGLELSTTYEVEVQANCGADGESEWVGPVSFTTDDCMPEDQISVNYALTDSYGDGWNGNYILVVDENCNIVNQLTIESGSSATGTLRVCGSYVQFLWYMGSYPTETSWVFTDNAGNVLFEGAGTADMATLDVLYTIDNNPYSTPTDVAASEVGPRSAKLSWTETGTATAWQILLTAGDDDEGTIINANSNPFVLTGLTPETDYFAQVRATGANGTSIWTCLGADFTTTEACPAPQNIVVSDVTANSALVSWLGFGESYDLRYAAMPSSKGMRSSINKKPAKTDFNCKTSFGNVRFASSNDKPAMVSGVTGIQHNRDGWYYYDNGETANNGIGTNGGNFYWGIMIPAGSYLETTLIKTSVYDELAMTGTVTIYNDGTDAPAGDALAQTDVTLTGAGAFVETEFSEPVTIDPSKNLWIVYYNGSGATYPAATCTAQGDANGRWVSVDGTSWMDVASAVEGCGNFMVRAYLEGAIEIDWIEVPGITASEYELTGLDPETTYLVQIRSNCGDDGQTDYVGTNFTTMGLCDNPHDLDTIEVNATSAILNWTGAQESYNLRYRHALEIDPTAPATIILTAGDIWQDSTGYQMLLDADATAYGTIIPESSGLTTGGDVADSIYAVFEYKIPVNADGALTTQNIVINNSISIQIPAGTYDWCITNPTPGDRVWIAASNGIGGRYDDFVFEPGVTYEFTIARYGNNDGVDLTTTRPMSDWTEVTVNEVPYTLTGLTAETYYEWQIQGVNASCGELEWSEIQNFTTPEQTNVTQVVTLTAGSNWFSTYLDITLEDLQAALVAASTPNKTITIKSHGANATYSRGRWNVPAAFTWDVANRFVIVLDEDIEISLEGMPIDPAEHPITIVGNGVSNWIGFPFSQSMTITEAFATLPPQNNDNVKDPSGNSVYNRGRWQGTTFTTLVPGHGYIFVSAPGSADRTLVYPAPSKK